MENRDILIDTCLIIDFLRSKNKESTVLWRLMDSYYCNLSSITVFELFAGASTETHYADVTRIVKWMKVFTVDEVVAREAGRMYIQLRASDRGIEFRDLFIAATATINKMMLATKNIRHFSRIASVDILDIDGM